MKELKGQENLKAAKEQWQESLCNKKAHKAMRNKRKNGRGKAWQVAV